VWTLGAPLPTPGLLAAAGATTGVLAPTRLYVIGGSSDGINALNKTQMYDPQTNSWTLGSSMHTARGLLSVAVVNDTLYAIGGTNNLLNPQSPTNTVNEQYFPSDYGKPAPSSFQNPTISPPIPQGTMMFYVIIAAVLIFSLMVIIVTLFLRKRRGSAPFKFRRGTYSL